MDPNGIAGTPTERWVWLAPDWSTHVEDAAEVGKRPPGATKVRVRTILYNDGRKVTVVLDRSGEPVGPDGQPTTPEAARPVATTTDADQQRIFNAAAAAARAEAPKTPQEGETRGPLTGPTREEYHDGVWVTRPNPVYVAPAAQQDEWHTEGRPDPNAPGGFDNSRPIMVRTVNGQRQTREPTGAELKDWNVAGQIQRNPGGKTDAEIEADAAKAAAAAKANQPQVVPTNTTEPFIVSQGPGGALTSVPNPNYKGPETKPGTSHFVQGPGGKTYIIPVDAQGVAGTPRDSGLPGDPASRDEQPYINPADKKTYIKVTTKDPATGQSKTVYLDPQTRQEVTLPGSAMAGITGLPSYTPDLTKPGAGLIDRVKQLDEMMAAGQLTWEQRQEVLAQDHVLTQTVASEFNAGVSLLQTNYANQTSQRNVDVTNAQHRASLANSHMTNAIGLMQHFSPYLGTVKGAAGKMFLSTMAAQLALATQYGGMKDYPREQMDPAVAAWAHRAVAGAGGPGAPGVPGAPGAPPVAPGVPGAPPVAPGAAGMAPGAPPLGPARDRFDTGPGNTLGPRVMTPQSGGMPPPPPGYEPALSWRAGAQQQEDFLSTPDPAALGTGEMAFGAVLPAVAPTDPMGGPMDFNAGVGPAPLAMRSAVPGLTPEQDEQARRELDRQLFAGARG